jgi:class 3 adenylate cyclase
MNDTPLIPSDPTQPSGERRQVTVLFADMVGFVAISERLGEEGTYALIQPIYQLMAGAVKEQGGSVKDFTGDGIMALFGVPEALEDAPLRACRAALLIHERLAAAAPAIAARHGVLPRMRIGVNSGLAVVTQIRSESAAMTALGDTVNLASRLQTLAEPGTVCLSEATQRLVQGLVETTFAGTHPIKGKAEPQKVYRLNAVRDGATRFEASVGRGLTAYVGREREMKILERALAEARSELRVIDIVAEPGMGKSRLLHEFRQRVGTDQAFIQTGSCSPGGRQTPFLPFVEIVRGSFQVRSGEAESEVARKLETGLTALGLRSRENLGLLFSLLGLKPPEGALAGLDGVLIGLRTRALLLNLLEARCRLSPVVLLIEDLHWIDSVSQEVLGRIVDGEAKLRLLILHTRRPEYEPPWREKPVVTTLRLELLPADEIRRLVQARLGVEAPPKALVRLVTEKAEGNALFAEEILGFLTERGALRTQGENVEFDAGAVGAALPASIQGLLTARVDRLAPQDRAILQAASVIGRRFDPRLLAVAADVGGDVDARLAAMRALDLVHTDGKSGDYAFKHALVREALYQSLLTAPRAALHLKIAEEIERQGGNNLADAVEMLAHHYGQTDRADKAFAYLAMAGAKSLWAYSFDEAGNHFAAAIVLLDEHPNCSGYQQIAEFLVDYTMYSNLSLKLNSTIKIVDHYMSSFDRFEYSGTCALVYHHYVFALLLSGRYADAGMAQDKLTALAAREGIEARPRAYALASAILLSSIIASRTYAIETFEPFSKKVIDLASTVDDVYLQYFTQFAVGWVEFHSGRAARANHAAQELLAVGHRMNDPRSIGFGMQLLGWIAIVSDDYAAALGFAEKGLTNACTALDREACNNAYCSALVLLRRPEGYRTLRNFIDQAKAGGWVYMQSGPDGTMGVALAFRGELAAAIRWLKKAIAKREREGYRGAADWYRLFLCEIYLEVVSGKEKPRLHFLVRNLLTLAIVMLSAQRKIAALVARVRENPQFDPNGHFIGRCEMILGRLYKTKRKGALAVRHLTEAKRIAAQFGPTPMLARIDAELAELAESLCQ